MYAVLCNPIFWNQINQAVTSKGEEIIVKAIDKEIDIMSEFERIGRTPIKHIIIDITPIQDTKKLIYAIKRYKIKNDKTQIIIIAPNVAPPSQVMDALVTIGVYDIIAPKAEKLEDIELESSILELLESPAPFKKAVRWFLDADLADEVQENPSPKAKNEKEVIERTLTITRERIVGTVVIAVAGTMKRIGTTHTTLAIAGFLRNNDFKVAVLEYHKSGHFTSIKNNYEDITEEGDYFLLDGIYYYPYNENLNVLDVLQHDYNYILIDMGQYNNCDLAEFRRANVKVIVSGVKDWELTELELMLRTEDRTQKLQNSKYSYYFNFADKESFEIIKTNMIDETYGQYKCYQAVLNPNPFTVTNESISLFKELLKDVLPETKQANTNKKNNKGMLDTAKGLFGSFKKKEG